MDQKNKQRYDYNKLNGRIVEVCGTRKEFAKRMGFSERTLSLKLNNKVSWKQPEIMKAIQVLGLEETDIQEYFFTLKVH